MKWNTKFSKILTKKFLFQEYIKNKKSTYQIAKKVGCCEGAVYYNLKKHGIRRRSFIDAGRLSWKRQRKLRNFKGKNNPNYKDSHCSKGHINHCIDCGRKINRQSKRCGTCEDIHHSGLLKGKHHTKKTIKKMSGKNNSNYGKVPKHGKGAHYKQSYMRSSWEIKYAKHCIKNHIKYRYEPKAFEITYKYEGIKKEGTYRPDFYLPETNTYIEIKGWWWSKTKAKFDGFKRKYKDIKIKVLTKPELQKIGVL